MGLADQLQYKETVQKIIDILKADARLTEGEKIAKYFFGLPIRLDHYPLIYVRLVGGPVEAATQASGQYRLDYAVAVIHRSGEQDVAEKFVYDTIEIIDEVLRAKPTLDGMVDDSFPARVDGETAVERDYAISGARLVLRTRKQL